MNYGQLKAAIASRLARGDLASIIPDFISLGESRIYYGFSDPEFNIKPLRLRSMLATETADLSSLPTGFLAVDRFTVPGTSSPRVLEYKTPAEFAALPESASFPRYYTLQDGGVSVEGGTPASFTFSYYKKFNALSADEDSNWLLENQPNVYFYSALIEAYQHIKNDSRTFGAARMFAAAANAATEADSVERTSGGVLAIPAWAPV
jgi:hypothetical protein